LIVAHGNSLRALIKFMESISDEGVAGVEMHFGSIFNYLLDEKGKMVEKDEIKIELVAPNA